MTNTIDPTKTKYYATLTGLIAASAEGERIDNPYVAMAPAIWEPDSGLGSQFIDHIDEVAHLTLLCEHEEWCNPTTMQERDQLIAMATNCALAITKAILNHEATS